MKKKNFIFTFLCVMVALCAMLTGFVGSTNDRVYAEGEEDTFVAISTDVFEDPSLYGLLCTLYAQINEVAYPASLSSESLMTYANTTGSHTQGEPITELDLSGKGITSITGLEYMNWKNIKVLVLDDNNISTISSTDLLTFTNLEEIYVRNSSLSDITLSGLTKLNKVYLSENNLKSVDLSKTTSTTLEANLANNDIVSFSDIALNSTTQYSLHVENNALTNFDSENTNVTCDIGLQKFASNVTVSTLISFYPMQINDKTIIQIYSVDSSDNLSLVDSKNSSSPAFTLSSGNYLFRYADENGLALYDETDIDTKKYQDLKVTICPDRPEVKVLFKGKEYEALEDAVVGRPSIKVERVAGLTYEYRIDRGAWIEFSSDTIELKSNSGLFNVFIRATENGIVSETSIVRLNTSVVSFLPNIVVVILLIAVLIVVLFGLSFLLKRYLI